MPRTVIQMFGQGLPCSMVQLGSLTIDPMQPWTEVLNPFRPLPDSHIADTVDTKIRDSFKNAKNTQFGGFLSKVLKLAVSSEDTKETRIDAIQRRTSYLLNHENTFNFLTDEVAAPPKVIEWLQNRVNRRQDILMVVRTITFTDANVLSEDMTAYSAQGDASLSPTQAIPALAPLGDVADIGVNVRAHGERSVSDGFQAVGDRIYGMEYQIGRAHV